MPLCPLYKSFATAGLDPSIHLQKHAGFVTFTPRKVPCYAATHAHPQRIACRASRRKYFLRAFTYHSSYSSHVP